MNEPLQDDEPAYYRVVIIHDDGTKEVLARNLSLRSAETFKMGISWRGKVVVERQSGFEPS